MFSLSMSTAVTPFFSAFLSLNGQSSSFFQSFSRISFQLILVHIFYKTHSAWHTVLAKFQVEKRAFCSIFQLYAILVQSVFDGFACIQHHFTFLFGCLLSFFKALKTVFLPLKHHFLGCIFPLVAMFLMVLRGFVYAITVYFYAFRLAFTSILPCVQQQNALHLAAYWLAFCTKTHSILHQNALRLAPKRTPFSGKQPKSRCKQWFL